MKVDDSRTQGQQEEAEVGVSEPGHPGISFVTLFSNYLLDSASTIDC